MNNFPALPSDSLLSISDHSSELKFKVKDSLPDLNLHFPNQRLVAGYYQLNWVDYLVKQSFKDSYISEILDTKFQAKILPMENITLLISWEDLAETSSGAIKFIIKNTDNEIKTQGKIFISKKV